jgi:hypothetical protein
MQRYFLFWFTLLISDFRFELSNKENHFWSLFWSVFHKKFYLLHYISNMCDLKISFKALKEAFLPCKPGKNERVWNLLKALIKW